MRSYILFLSFFNSDKKMVAHFEEWVRKHFDVIQSTTDIDELGGREGMEVVVGDHHTGGFEFRMGQLAELVRDLGGEFQITFKMMEK